MPGAEDGGAMDSFLLGGSFLRGGASAAEEEAEEQKADRGDRKGSL